MVKVTAAPASMAVPRLSPEKVTPVVVRRPVMVRGCVVTLFVMVSVACQVS